MKKHLFSGVLVLAVLFVAAGASTLYAGNCCAVASNGCKMDAQAKGCPSAQKLSANCDPSQCKPMTAEQCKAMGCDPESCKPMTPEECKAKGCDPGACTTTGAKASHAAVKTQMSPGCAESPNCKPGAGCGKLVKATGSDVKPAKAEKDI